MKTSFAIIIPLAVGTLLACHRPAFAQGSLTPPGAPAPTMKTLAQIEPRIPISSLPFTITNSGSYYLTGTLTNLAFGDGIMIAADNVTLDLGGFALIGGVGSGSAIVVPSAHKQIAVRNGSVRQWGGTAVLLYNASWCQVDQLQIADSGSSALYMGDNSLVSACTVTNATGYGILIGGACRVKDCLVMSATITGFSVGDRSTVTDCTCQTSGGYGFYLGADCAASHCAAINNTSIGFSVGDHGNLTDCTAARNGSYGFQVQGRACKLTGCVASFSGAGASGFSVNDGTLVKDCTAISNTGDGIDAVHGCVISGCAVRANGGNGMSVDYGTVVIGCAAVENTGIGISAGGNGILIKDCNANSNIGDGIRAAHGAQILDNLCSANGTVANTNAAGIHITGLNNRVEGNTLTFNHNTGLQVDNANGANLIIRNSAFSNYGSAYVIAPGNKDAQILSVGSGFTSSNSWANVQ